MTEAAVARGSATGRRAAVVALVGNPNAGKTTVFNALTGSFQRVGNYPGVTVERLSGRFAAGDWEIECLDLPGLYSLEPISEDEQVAVDVIVGRGPEGRPPDVLVCVIDANNLERNLFLFGELMSLGKRLLVALTMTDFAREAGRPVDSEGLSRLLGVPVVPVIGHRRRGVEALKRAIAGELEREDWLARGSADRWRVGADYSDVGFRGKANGASENFGQRILWLDNSAYTRDRYRWAERIARAVTRTDSSKAKRRISDRIDNVLTHRVYGLVAFAALMYVIFQSIYTIAAPVMDWIERGFGAGAAFVSESLTGYPVLNSFLADGVITGVGSVVVFLPQILILFFFIAALEGTGYLARAAFLMDRLLGWCGLNGRAFIPLLSSFACAIPGVMAARVMPDAKSRLATILVAPLMSCSARLPVYLLLIGAFIEPRFGPVWAGAALFGMHFLGLALAIPIVWFLNRSVIKGKRLPMVLELPPYQWPKWRDVALTLYLRAKVFLKVAGTMILLMSVLIWALLFFPRSEASLRAYAAEYDALPVSLREAISKEHYVDERQIENSYLGRFGKSIEPLFLPAGFDWRITTAILAAFPARETVVPALGVIFSVGGDVDEESRDLRRALTNARWPDGRPLVTPWTAVGLMVFFALCAQCMSTLAVVKRETNSWKWPLFMFSYMTLLAYGAAVIVHQIGKLV